MKLRARGRDVTWVFCHKIWCNLIFTGHPSSDVHCLEKYPLISENTFSAMSAVITGCIGIHVESMEGAKWLPVDTKLRSAIVRVGIIYHQIRLATSANTSAKEIILISCSTHRQHRATLLYYLFFLNRILEKQCRGISHLKAPFLIHRSTRIRNSWF